MYHFHCHNNSLAALYSLVSSCCIFWLCEWRCCPAVQVKTLSGIRYFFLHQTFSILLPYYDWLDVDNVNACRIKAEYLNLEFKACVEEETLYKNAAEKVLSFTVCWLFNVTGLKGPEEALSLHSFLTKLLLTSQFSCLLPLATAGEKKLVLVCFNLIFEWNSSSTNLGTLRNFNHRANQNQTTER